MPSPVCLANVQSRAASRAGQSTTRVRDVSKSRTLRLLQPPAADRRRLDRRSPATWHTNPSRMEAMPHTSNLIPTWPGVSPTSTRGGSARISVLKQREIAPMTSPSNTSMRTGREFLTTADTLSPKTCPILRIVTVTTPLMYCDLSSEAAQYEIPPASQLMTVTELPMANNTTAHKRQPQRTQRVQTPRRFIISSVL